MRIYNLTTLTKERIIRAGILLAVVLFISIFPFTNTTYGATDTVNYCLDWTDKNDFDPQKINRPCYKSFLGCDNGKKLFESLPNVELVGSKQCYESTLPIGENLYKEPISNNSGAETSVTSGPLVPCGGPDCDFNQLIKLIKNVINFLLFVIAAPLAAIVFAYAGFLFLTSRGNEQQISQAKQIFWSVLIGFVIAFGAWLIVDAITSALLKDSVNTFLGE